MLSRLDGRSRRQLAADSQQGVSVRGCRLLLDLSCGSPRRQCPCAPSPRLGAANPKARRVGVAKAKPSVPPSHRTARSVRCGALSRCTGAPRDVQWWNRARL